MAAAGGNWECPTLLGYQDEEVGQHKVDYTTSKIGGAPNYPPGQSLPGDLLVCSLCSTQRCVLVCQLYAPLDHSPFHRTLYIFACPAPACWNKSESWKCYRLQYAEPTSSSSSAAAAPPPAAQPAATDWGIDDADDWGAGEDNAAAGGGRGGGAFDQEDDDNGNCCPLQPGNDTLSQNRNLNNQNVVELERLTLGSSSDQGRQPAQTHHSPSLSELSDFSSSCDLSLVSNDSNANVDGARATTTGGGGHHHSSSSGGAGSRDTALYGTQATAEIETDQDGMDVIAVEDLLQDPNSGLDDNRAGGTRLPDLLFGRADAAVGDAADTADVSDGGNTMELVSYFLAVEQERMQASNPSLTDHERQLLLEYKAKETAGGAKISVPGLEQLPGGQEEQHEKDGSRNKNKANKAKSLGSKTAAAAQDADGYEKAMPKHGDALWHKFVSVVQENPGQMLRYSRATRGHGPLFLSPPAAGTLPKQCPHCRGEVIPEIQILPSMINALSPRRAVDTGAHGARGCPDSPSGTTVVEFGTVIVYTCLKSCWAVEGGAAATPPRSERLLVQAENM